MEFLISLIGNVFQFFPSLVPRPGYCVRCEYHVGQLRAEARWLKSKRDDVRKEVSLAERKGMEVTNLVSQWQDDVASLLPRADEIVADLQREQGAVGGWWRAPRAYYRLGKRAADARAKVVSLLEQGSTFERLAAPVFIRTEVLPVTTTPLISPDPLLARLRDAFLEDAGSVIGIYGMPGVGKTTLLRHFNNTFLSAVAVSMGIDLVIYVEVTEDYSAAAVQRAIMGRLGLPWDDDRTTKEKALALFTYLHKWNFVLLLDDVWKPLNLDELGVPVPGCQGKSKVLLTTRLEQLCDQMETRPLAKDMVSMCGGLPLALTTVARAMVCKRLTQEWDHCKALLNLAPWQLECFKDSLLTSLKRSYDNLWNDDLRGCVLYCSLFTGELLKESLVERLIAEGFVSDFTTDDMDNLYNKGHYMLGVLVTSSLLEAAGDYHVKMHPMVRAMALWEATDRGKMENKWLVRTGPHTSAAPPAKRWSSAERISLTRTDIRELNETPTCSILKTLLLQSNRFLERICHGFFSFMPCLRLLDLSRTQLTTLPSEIKLLVTLQYLCLNDTSIHSLPDGIGALVNLRFLLLSNVHIESVAVGVLNLLTALQVLCMDHCHSSWIDVDNREVEPSSSRKKIKMQPEQGQGVNLRELESLKNLHILDIAVQTRSSLEKLSLSPYLAERLRNLHIKDCSELETLQFSPSSLWRYMNKLKRINITGCCNLGDVLVAGGEYSYEQLCSSDSVIGMRRIDVPNVPVDIDNWFGSLTLTKKMNAIRLKSLERAKPVALLPSLQTIILHDLPKVKLVWQCGTLEQLCSLKISSCNGLEHLVYFSEDIRMAGEGASSQQPIIKTIFPNLKELELENLARMRSISPENITMDFPHLEKLKVVRCDKLKKLKLVAGSLRELQCAQWWWNALEWDNENHKSAFSASVKSLQ
ncbi:unnamed protein product [Miscanthus lutarioriparius]|uniref:AAA+ ATPase domain-containing protein n=1 Tax=Miscanthus lutarioriparius TaxID=422564 RepID=A0A811RMI0_9POAL|nr:unnamed protein product [Miscanthus lutarioriparius]